MMRPRLATLSLPFLPCSISDIFCCGSSLFFSFSSFVFVAYFPPTLLFLYPPQNPHNFSSCLPVLPYTHFRVIVALRNLPRLNRQFACTDTDQHLCAVLPVLPSISLQALSLCSYFLSSNYTTNGRRTQTR